MSYRIFDSIVDSDIEFPELEPAAMAAADVRVSLGRSCETGRSHDWFHVWYRDDARTKVDSSIARLAEGHLLRFDGQADFRILEGGRHVVCEPFPGIPLDTVRHLLLDHVLPRMAGQGGALVLHASAVDLGPTGGIAFIGKSGWGKSTLASSFRDTGARFLTDDCLKLNVSHGQLIGIPAYAGARLWDDSVDALFPAGTARAAVSHRNSKRRVGFGLGGHARSAVIKALFFLEPPGGETRGGGITISDVSGTRAIVELIKRSFLLDVKCSVSAERQFAAVGAILATGPALFSLQYRREYSGLPEVRRAVAHAVAVSGRSRCGDETAAQQPANQEVNGK